MKHYRFLSVIAAVAGLAVATPALSAELNAAVAANFTAAAKEIAAAFEKKTGDKVVLSFGSTGQLATQIINGAPYDVFLAADSARPVKLETEGYTGTAQPRFTYAIGKLVLWSADPNVVDANGDVLKSGDFGKLAVANPKTAPYGAAGMQTIEKLGLTDSLQPKLVFGQNVAQTHQFIASGAATLGFIALAQVVNMEGGSQWVVPESLYAPINQQAVLLKKGDENAAAKAFVDYLQGTEAAAIITRYGYGTEKPGS